MNLGVKWPIYLLYYNRVTVPINQALRTWYILYTVQYNMSRTMRNKMNSIWVHVNLKKKVLQPHCEANMNTWYKEKSINTGFAGDQSISSYNCALHLQEQKGFKNRQVEKSSSPHLGSNWSLKVDKMHPMIFIFQTLSVYVHCLL